MNTLDQVASSIIKDQEKVIGPLAWDEAAQVTGLQILDRKTGKVEIVANSDHGKVIDDLVSQYVELFGRAAREACREAAAPLIAGLPAAEVPSSLK